MENQINELELKKSNNISKIAIGKNIDGKEVEFTFNTAVNCSNNKLTELHLPNGVKQVFCFNNKLTELVLPNGVENVYCDNNPIKEIMLPKTIKYAYLPLNCKVLNLDEFKDKYEVKITFV